ncbi:Cof-type HAD-IIB family hydrolase [Corynebacterium uberis]|uniref:Cof-type HAD-IIB family hydrolase n=1 Tax=Corynebacterium TaxID=1716 RepID=UPI001D0B5E8B|nr:Cof-type HAD-IIB family hydrolase [Corynebacterium uberis]MCZ9308809.1 Cof-type HAD-IIB family hydrolase [Corynebacterium sp. c6VSa_13]UDL72663.1 Cof-type HAD-IIB family hydrolase [Corynebacterium uberis]UDL76461.1 Cof-type HAD-IIB family hydrolase [Corynebacterium uberis]UDL78673.1 Cof-type HAD-IIB family hydrolase [Corynebacterium uberis]UDL80952.1 Cof-type HAD-IIB family hydrolase [Corynebacterium uberis]
MDYRLIAADMDGTFLDGQGHIPADFWEFYPRLRAAGIAFTPSSGRQLATLTEMFEPLSGELDFIAENGAVVVAHGDIVSTTPMPMDAVHSVIDAVRGTTMNVVVCHPLRAYTETPPVEELSYYHSIEQVADLHEVAERDEVVKLAVNCRNGATDQLAATLADAAAGQHVVISSARWIDVMNPAANKGTALTELARHTGITLDQTLAFGDYLNDYELLTAAGTSYAMANAHPALKEIADHIAPPHTEGGVMQVLRELFAD